MSWDATIRCSCCQSMLGDWNYTHNTTSMIREALDRAGVQLADRESWYDRLDGTAARVGAAYLSSIIQQFEADPASFIALDPPNGWGSFGGLLAQLRAMRDRGIDAPAEAVWEADG